jgi:hypothetical protein
VTYPDPAIGALLGVGAQVVLTVDASRTGNVSDKPGQIASVLVSPDGVPIMVVLRVEGGGLRGWNWSHVVGIRPAEVPHPGLRTEPPAAVEMHPGLR